MTDISKLRLSILIFILACVVIIATKSFAEGKRHAFMFATETQIFNIKCENTNLVLEFTTIYDPEIDQYGSKLNRFILTQNKNNKTLDLTRQVSKHVDGLKHPYVTNNICMPDKNFSITISSKTTEKCKKQTYKNLIIRGYFIDDKQKYTIKIAGKRNKCNYKNK